MQMSITSLASHFALLALAGLVFSAAISDILRFRIPNRICLALVLLYPAYVLATSQPVAWLPALAVALACLIVGFILFLHNACGAGAMAATIAAAEVLGAERGYLVEYTTSHDVEKKGEFRMAVGYAGLLF